ncbi:MAG: hypothetical protein NZM04_05445 [Methylacidiphilales bacterium]|nr:hypothetical protein [Candidatus Methylacidiphilales bacterium]
MVGNIIGKAITYPFKKPQLLLLGFLAEFGTIAFNTINPSLGLTPDSIASGNQALPDISNLSPFIAILGLCCVLIFFIVVFVFLSTISSTAMISIVQQSEANRTPSLSLAFSVGSNRFLRVFFMRLLLSIPAIIIGGILFLLFGGAFIQALNAQNTPGGSTNQMDVFSLLCAACGSICFLGSYGIIAQIIRVLGEPAIVIENRDIFSSMSRAWKLFTGAIGSYIAVFLAIFIIGGIINFISSLSSQLLAGAHIAKLIESGEGISVFIGIASSGLAFIINSVAFSYLSGMTTSAWSLFFIENAAREDQSSQLQAT